MSAQMAVGHLLSAVPQVNRAVALEPTAEGLLVSIPTRRPRWLVAPLSWLLPFSGQRCVELDAPGKAVLELCDGQRNVEDVIERFASDNKLSFRESQLAVTQFLKELLRRGIVALVGMDRHETD
jgi:hypothetical protein